MLEVLSMELTELRPLEDFPTDHYELRASLHGYTSGIGGGFVFRSERASDEEGRWSSDREKRRGFWPGRWYLYRLSLGIETEEREISTD